MLKGSRSVTRAVSSSASAALPGDLSRGRRARPRAAWPRLAWAAALAAAAALLFWCYLRQSQTTAVNADGSGVVLQGWDMLHGNLLLSGWWLADVSFYAFEVPLDAVVAAVHGLDADVVHITAAIIYTALVLSAALLARGTAKGREGAARAVLAAGIMVAPGFSPGTRVLIGSPDHAGVGVPILLTLLLVDRARERWWVPPAACVLLVWAQVDDPLATFAAAGPLALVCLVRAGIGLARRRRAGWYDAPLFAAAGLSYELAHAAVGAIKGAGGFTMESLSHATQIAPFSAWGTQLLHAGQNVLILFGADYFDQPAGIRTAIAIVHFAGVLLALCGLLAGIAGLFRRADRVTQTLTVGALVTFGAGAFGTTMPVISGAHEIAAVLPFGAVLAGRTLGPWLLRHRLPRVTLAPLLGAALACYLAALGYSVSQPARPAEMASLADWLVSHHLTSGLSRYWAANSTTLASGGRVRVAAAQANGTVAYPWVTKPSWYDPAVSYANFVIATAAGKNGNPYAFGVHGAERNFGKPARTYHQGGYVIMVWDKNLLRQMTPPVQPNVEG